VLTPPAKRCADCRIEHTFLLPSGIKLGESASSQYPHKKVEKSRVVDLLPFKVILVLHFHIMLLSAFSYDYRDSFIKEIESWGVM